MTPGWLASNVAETGAQVWVPTQPGRGITPLLLLARALRSGGWDAVVTNTARAAFFVSLLKPRRLKHIYYVRDALSGGWMTGWRRRLLLRVALRGSDAFIANSLWTAQSMPSHGGRRSKPVLVAYPLCGVVSVDPVARVAPRAPLRVLSLSRLAPWKGVDVLVQAMRQLEQDGLSDEFELQLAGSALFNDQAFAQEVMEAARGLTMPTAILGHVEDVESLLDDADILVMASTSPEPFGQVMIQAMARGVAVVATDHGGPREVIKDRISGLLIRPGDAYALAASLDLLRRDCDLRARLAKEGAAVARTFDDNTAGQSLDRILDQLVLQLKSSPR